MPTFQTVIDIIYNENYKSNEITKIKIVINKLINKKILIFAGYEKIR